jgi:protein-tyrosine phosphatase
VRWEEVQRVFFVCTRNLCRSPFAESIAHGVGLEALSWGLTLEAGRPADEAARRVAADFGADLGQHRSRRFAPAELREGDLVAAMEPAQARLIATALPAATPVQLTLLGLWADPPRVYLHDPLGKQDAYFRECFGIIDGAVRRIAVMVTPMPPRTR